ncbi:OLC1v1019581C1 [Oldenlandia corymbosa var. corymbosa]|uniref:OLC1v1019581C1 n=1 Tax=Oldenlandia corymbosa var. corymbosa TaxID=529605 RepID=A0AAV1EER3_OLDCO|nr:OLC1v1019581C1 [Oldenlandia corymbosa var. corymbosa]
MTTLSRPIKCYNPLRFGYEKDNVFKPLWPFGPEGWRKHSEEEGPEFKQKSAVSVLEMVMNMSGFDSRRLVDELRDILPIVKEAYPESGLHNCDDEEVIKSFAADGCVFILVVFSILGVELGFPEQHALLGKGQVREGIEKWLRSIFYVGNQIPLYVVEKLIKSLKHLGDLWEKIKDSQPSGILEKTLFRFMTIDPSQVSKPVDVMECLRSVILGPQSSQLCIWVVGRSDIEGKTIPTKSASALSRCGYVFKPLPDEFGSRAIKCEHQWGKVAVYLPCIEVFSAAWLELMFTSVRNYEFLHHGPIFQLESTHYFNLLSTLIRSLDDVKVLESGGVLGGVDLDSLPRILQPFYKPPPFDPLHLKEIRSYNPRLAVFWNFKGRIITSLVVCNILLTLQLASLQTGYTILGNYKHH